MPMMKNFFLFLLLIIIPSNTYAGSFNVVPVKIIFDSNKKIADLRIKNETSEKVTIQLRAYEWLQDEEGKDTYSPTEDLVYFPRIFTLEGDQERRIKIGYDKKPSNVEKTFRLYLEELPQAVTSGTPQLRVAIKIGMPIFVLPVNKIKASGAIDKVALLKGKVALLVKNKSGVHFFVRTIKMIGMDSSGNTVLTSTKKGWYLLANGRASYSLDITEDTCQRLKEITIEIETDTFTLKDKFSVDPKTCKN
jgi:fimbrial chaperone protein